MKNILYIAVIAMSLTSCMDKFLDTDSPTSNPTSDVFANEVLTEAALMGVYSTLPGAFGSSMTIWQGNTDIELTQNFNETGYSSSSGNIAPSNYYDHANNDRTRWQNIYLGLELATEAVDGIRNSELTRQNPTLMNRFLGEALTLRAMVAFHLVCLYGDIPYDVEPAKSDLSNVYIGKVDKDSILTSLVRDVREAIEYLPWMGSESKYNVERVTKGFAKGLLARIALYAGGWLLRDGNTFPDADHERLSKIIAMNGYYVGRRKDWKDYYAIAEQQCAEIIGSSENPHKLDTDYENIWKTVCHLDYNVSNENLFEIGHGVGTSGDVGATIGYGVAADSKYSSRSLGGNYMTHHAYYFYSFTKGDKRRDVACIWRSYSSRNVEELSNSMLDVRSGKWRIYWMSDQYLTLFKEATQRISTGINWIVMRYSDIYLMYAEARNELHGADTENAVAGMTARQALEKVRERAFGIGSASIKQYDTDFFKAIVNERAWEFGGENIRKNDLVRWGLLSDKIEEMKEGLCLMIDNTQSVRIFDKVYQPEDFPRTVRYSYKDNEYIDENSINYYSSDEIVGTEEVSWFPTNYEKRGSRTGYKDDPAKILTSCTGLNTRYDYSALLGRMQYGNEIAEILSKRPMGNGVCNYRHVFAIYYEDVYRSKGAYANAYGY